MKVIKASKRSRNTGLPLRRLAAYGIVILVIIGIFAVWGITLLANLSNFWDSVRGSNNAAPLQNNTIVLAPSLTPLPLITNKRTVDITGSSQPGAVVTLYRDGNKVDSQVAGNDSQFVFKAVALKESLNSFSAKAKLNGQDSSDSNIVRITLDTIAPKLVVDQPGDGATVTSQYVTVSGKTDPKAVVTVNDAQQVVGADGNFSGVATMTQSGSNIITVISTDEAGNKTTVTRTVTYTPS